jgi:archaellum biogenesis protein FlaJ (TadC family)
MAQEQVEALKKQLAEVMKVAEQWHQKYNEAALQAHSSTPQEETR